MFSLQCTSTLKGALLFALVLAIWAIPIAPAEQGTANESLIDRVESNKTEAELDLKIDPKITVRDFLSNLDRYIGHVNLVYIVAMAVIGLGLGLGGALIFKDVRELRNDVRREIDAANAKIGAAEADVLKAKLALVEEKEKLRPLLDELQKGNDTQKQALLRAIDLSRCLTSSIVGGTVHSLVSGQITTLNDIQTILTPNVESLLKETITLARRVKELTLYEAPGIPSNGDLLTFATVTVHEASAQKRLGRFGAALRILEEELLPLAPQIKRMGERYLAPVYYNAACYACLLDTGNQEKVLDYLEKAIDLNEAYRRVALRDTDLARVNSQNRFTQMCAGRQSGSVDRAVV